MSTRSTSVSPARSWIDDLHAALRTAHAAQAGYVWVNEVSRHFLGAPFGGVKQSGLGREECLEELLSFTQGEEHPHALCACRARLEKCGRRDSARISSPFRGTAKERGRLGAKHFSPPVSAGRSAAGTAVAPTMADVAVAAAWHDRGHASNIVVEHTWDRTLASRDERACSLHDIRGPAVAGLNS